MSGANLQARRATIEDVPRLVALWREEKMPWQDLEKRFKEFQVIESEDGQLLCAIGVQIAGKEGRIHSEAFAHQELADALRAKFWERAQVLAQNLNIARLWTQSASPFWHEAGFEPAPSESVTQLAGLMWTDPRPWLLRRLRDDPAPAKIVEMEFARFKEASAAETEKMRVQAGRLRVAAYLVGIAVFILVILWAYTFWRARQHMPH